jgi:hypothetical protein
MLIQLLHGLQHVIIAGLIEDKAQRLRRASGWNGNLDRGTRIDVRQHNG